MQRGDVGDIAEVSVVLEATCDGLREVSAHFNIRSEVEPVSDTGSVPGAFERGINGPVEVAFLSVDNRPNLPGPGVPRKDSSLIANLHGQARTDGPVPAERSANARTNVVANPLPACLTARARKDIETNLEPVIEALGDFDRLMDRMVCGLSPVGGFELPDGSEVRMQLNHCGPGSNGFGAIDLDLVVALRTGCRGKDAHQRKGQDEGLQKGAPERRRAGTWTPVFHDCTAG